MKQMQALKHSNDIEVSFLTAEIEARNYSK